MITNIQNKKFYCYSGFPRSGNTLLASILSQNPDIHATQQSVLPDIFFSIDKIKQSYRYLAWPDDAALYGIYSNIFHNFYNNYEKKYIIERADWITPYNISNLIKYCPNEIKIVILVRDILDIIKSYLKLCEQYPNFFINSMYNDLDKSTIYKSEMETKADLIMEKDGFVDAILYSIHYLLKNNFDKVNLKFVEYEDLIGFPKKVIEEIYDFYKIPKFNHNYTKLKQLGFNNMSYNDTVYGAPMHTIFEDNVSKIENNIVLEESIIRKYSNLNIWRNTNSYGKV